MKQELIRSYQDMK